MSVFYWVRKCYKEQRANKGPLLELHRLLLAAPLRIVGTGYLSPDKIKLLVFFSVQSVQFRQLQTKLPFTYYPVFVFSEVCS